MSIILYKICHIIVIVVLSFSPFRYVNFCLYIIILCYWEHTNLASCSAPCGLILLCKMCWNWLAFTSCRLWISQVHSKWHLAGGLKSATMGIITLWKLANATKSCSPMIVSLFLFIEQHTITFIVGRFLFSHGFSPHISFTSSDITLDMPAYF